MGSSYSVRAVRCDYRASDEEVYERVRAATDGLDRSWEKLERANAIAIKANMSKPPENVARFSGRRRELVDEAVLRAVFRRLRERTKARLFVVDSMFERTPEQPLLALNYREILDEFGVSFVDGHQMPLASYEVPGGGNMFARYRLSAAIAEADAFVSVAKLKNHAFQGVTLSLKNLFGLPPVRSDCRPRTYFHHIVRLSHVLPDLGLITNACLNVVDGLTGQAGREWGGAGRISNVLLAGDHPIATDACGTWLMGHDPKTDWPSQPFVRDRSALRVAADAGFGTVDLKEIDFQSEVEPPVGEYLTVETDPFEMVARWRETTCEQALFYRDHQREIVGRYAGEYVMLQDGKVVWHGPDASELQSRRVLSGSKKDSALYLKLADPDEWECERFEVYERELRRTREVIAGRGG